MCSKLESFLVFDQSENFVSERLNGNKYGSKQNILQHILTFGLYSTLELFDMETQTPLESNSTNT